MIDRAMHNLNPVAGGQSEVIPRTKSLSPSALERHDLEQDIDELRSSIESLESSRARLRDLLPSENAKRSGSVWSDLTEIVTDFFEAAGEAIGEATEDDDDNVAAKAGKTVSRVVSTDWSKTLADAFGRLRDRLSADLRPDPSAPPPVAELGSGARRAGFGIGAAQRGSPAEAGSRRRARSRY